jgi:hypothetical protein
MIKSSNEPTKLKLNLSVSMDKNGKKSDSRMETLSEAYTPSASRLNFLTKALQDLDPKNTSENNATDRDGSKEPPSTITMSGKIAVKDALKLLNDIDKDNPNTSDYTPKKEKLESIKKNFLKGRSIKQLSIMEKFEYYKLVNENAFTSYFWQVTVWVPSSEPGGKTEAVRSKKHHRLNNISIKELAKRLSTYQIEWAESKGTTDKSSSENSTNADPSDHETTDETVDNK